MTALQISELFCVSERTVRRYVKIFSTTGDIEPARRRHGPEHLLGDFEQLTLLKIILDHPGIYLFEIQGELEKVGVQISVPTICRTLKLMGCSRQVMHHVALQRSDASRARFMLEISVYDPAMLIWLDESGCDRRNTVRKYGYSIRGIPLCDHCHGYSNVRSWGGGGGGRGLSVMEIPHLFQVMGGAIAPP